MFFINEFMLQLKEKGNDKFKVGKILEFTKGYPVKHKETDIDIEIENLSEAFVVKANEVIVMISSLNFMAKIAKVNDKYYFVILTPDSEATDKDKWEQGSRILTDILSIFTPSIEKVMPKLPELKSPLLRFSVEDYIRVNVYYPDACFSAFTVVAEVNGNFNTRGLEFLLGQIEAIYEDITNENEFSIYKELRSLTADLETLIQYLQISIRNQKLGG